MTEQNDLPDNNGFKTPEDYFEQLEDRLMEHSRGAIPEEPGFAVPDGYFQQLEQRVMDTVLEEPPVIAIGKSRKTQWTWFATAVAACLLLLLVWGPGQEPDLLWPEEAEMMAYLEEESLSLSTDELVSYMDESQLDELLQQPLAEEKELETYLLETLDDTELLIELQQ